MSDTLAERLWESHVVRQTAGEPDLLYVDLHLVHEVTSPQAFDGLRLAGRGVRRPDLPVATADHNVPPLGGSGPGLPPVGPGGPVAGPGAPVPGGAPRQDTCEVGLRPLPTGR